MQMGRYFLQRAQIVLGDTVEERSVTANMADHIKKREKSSLSTGNTRKRRRLANKQFDFPREICECSTETLKHLQVTFLLLYFSFMSVCLVPYFSISIRHQQQPPAQSNQ